MYKVHHTFTAILVGKGLLLLFHKIFSLVPPLVFLNKHNTSMMISLNVASFCISPFHHPHRAWVSQWHDLTSLRSWMHHNMAGGVPFGEHVATPSKVLCMQWSTNILRLWSLMQTHRRHWQILIYYWLPSAFCFWWLNQWQGTSTTIMWHYTWWSPALIVSSDWCPSLPRWQCSSSMSLPSLYLQITGTSPLTTLHAAGDHNGMTDISSTWFGHIV